MLITFGMGLQGKEVPLVSLEGLLHFRQEACKGSADERYMMMTLSGQFKGEVDLRWHLVPISDKTHSNIPFHLWMERIMHQRVKYQHRTKGWLFQTSTGARAKFAVLSTCCCSWHVKEDDRVFQILSCSMIVSDNKYKIRREIILQ